MDSLHVSPSPQLRMEDEATKIDEDVNHVLRKDARRVEAEETASKDFKVEV